VYEVIDNTRKTCRVSSYLLDIFIIEINNWIITTVHLSQS